MKAWKREEYEPKEGPSDSFAPNRRIQPRGVKSNSVKGMRGAKAVGRRSSYTANGSIMTQVLSPSLGSS